MPQPSLPLCAARAITRSYAGASMRTLRTPIPKRRPLSSKAGSKRPTAKPLPYQPAQPKPPPPPPAPPPQRARGDKAPMSDLVRERWVGILGFGGAILCLGYFTASLVMYWRREPATCYPVGLEPETPSGRPSIQSPYEFDLHLDKQEWRLGITKLRRELGSKARGHVLEVVVGTGRNLEFYNWEHITEALTAHEREAAGKSWWSWISNSEGGTDDKGSKAQNSAMLSFTGVDISPGMLDISLKRIRQVVPHMTDQVPKRPSFAILAANVKPNDPEKQQQAHTVSFLDNKIRILQSDVQTGLPAPPTLPSNPHPHPQKYDTILQTFGLCSVRDPVALLAQMASALQPNTGRILLLEHGRSLWGLVNGFLDRGARGHHERFGCWWNRDIEGIVTAAAARVPGLEIVRLERPGWTTAGTHVVVELRVRDGSARERVPKKPNPAGWAAVLPALLSTKPSGDS